MPLVPLFAVATILALPSSHVLAPSRAGLSQPGPEHERLSFLIGSWRVVDTTTAGPMTTPGKTTTGTTNCEWFDRKFQVVCKSDFTLPAGTLLRQLEVFAYDAGERGYTRYYISSDGVAVLTKGYVSGKTWNWGPIANEVNGKSLTATVTVTEVSPDSWASKVTVSMDGRPAQVVSEGTATRIHEGVDQATHADRAGLIVGSKEHPNPTETREKVAPKDSGRLSILRNKFAVSYDSTKWKVSKTEDSITQLSHVSGEAWVRVIHERIEISPDHFTEVILMNAKEVDPGIKIVNETPLEVSGLQARIIRYEGSVGGVKVTFLNQIGSSTEGTIQIVAFVPTNLFSEYQRDILEFFAGLGKNTDGK